ncbi:MAG: MFS transporter, partial [Salinivirgaceae bacterium]|nr:MFS transporter [Salinivirgaceae bacterium]
MSTNQKISLSYPILLAVIASIGGLLFGFNAGIISGALPFLVNSWGGLSTQQSDLIIISTLIGATIGALVSIKLSDTYGRRVLLIGTSIIYAIGAVLSGAAISVSFLLISRLILGIAMGVSSCIVPLYISEISPAKNRGALVSLFQLMITIGILLSFFSNTLMANEFDPFSWRKMFYLGAIPSI